MEIDAPYKISLDVDEPDQFDYDALLSLKYTYDDFYKMLEDEVKLIKKIGQVQYNDDGNSLSILK